MESIIKSNVTEIPLVFKEEPIEIPIEYENPNSAMPFCKQEAEQGCKAGISGRDTSITADSNMANAKVESYIETKPPDYSIDVAEVDVKQESLKTCTAGGSEIGNIKNVEHTSKEKLIKFSDDESNCYSQQVNKEPTMISNNTRENNSCIENDKGTQICISPEKSGESFSKTECTNVKRKKLYPCNICGKSFVRSGYLLGHKRMHSGDKRHGCQVCGKLFPQSTDLKCHMRVHTGEKPYYCQECGKYFSYSGGFAAHKAVHTGVKPHNCKVCGKKFRRKSDLVRHAEIHTHDKLQVDEKLRTCQQCGILFSRVGSLTRHMRIHSSEKPYTGWL